MGLLKRNYIELGLKKQIALVAGSSRGIGLAIAKSLLEEGCRVCLTGRNLVDLNGAATELKKLYPAENVLVLAGDLSEKNCAQAVLAYMQDEWGGLDILVANLGNGSGISGWLPSNEEWEGLFNLNLWASIRLAQAVIPAMIARKGGSIAFIGSIAGMEMTTAPLPYSTAKAALIHYSKNLARIVAVHGIRVNTVSPGNIWFEGGTWERHYAANPELVQQYIAAEVPMKRFGLVEEVASLVTFICSPKASFITGACFIADGGQTRRV